MRWHYKQRFIQITGAYFVSKSNFLLDQAGINKKTNIFTNFQMLQQSDHACLPMGAELESFAEEIATANQAQCVQKRNQVCPQEFADLPFTRISNIRNLATCLANVTFRGDCAVNYRDVIGKHRERYTLSITSDNYHYYTLRVCIYK